MMQDAGAAKTMPPDGHVRVSFRAKLLCDEIVRGGLPGGTSGVVEVVGAGLANRYRPGQRVAVVFPTSGPSDDTLPAQRDFCRAGFRRGSRRPAGCYVSIFPRPRSPSTR